MNSSASRNLQVENHLFQNLEGFFETLCDRDKGVPIRLGLRQIKPRFGRTSSASGDDRGSKNVEGSGVRYVLRNKHPVHMAQIGVAIGIVSA